MLKSPSHPMLLFTGLVVLLIAGCGDDDPTCPGGGSSLGDWQVVDLGQQLEGAPMVAVAFAGNIGLALGFASDFAPLIYRQQMDGSWQPVQWPDLPARATFFDLALDAAGDAVLAGYQTDRSVSGGLIWDRRGDTPQQVQFPSFAMLTVDGSESLFVAGGMSTGGELWTSTAVGVWNDDPLPLTGTNDSGFQDVCVRGDLAAACGYDDGADTLQVILQRSVNTDWVKVDLGIAGTSGRAFLCVALSEEGGIFVGGSIGAGGPSPRAFLSLRSASADWTDLVLPDPEALEAVNDILIADDGSVYLACSGEGESTTAHLLRTTDAGTQQEISPFPGELNQLAEAADGTVYAVGLQRDVADGSVRGIMLKRRP